MVRVLICDLLLAQPRPHVAATPGHRAREGRAADRVVNGGACQRISNVIPTPQGLSIRWAAADRYRKWGWLAGGLRAVL
jgi:hypothetical protein